MTMEKSWVMTMDRTDKEHEEYRRKVVPQVRCGLWSWDWNQLMVGEEWPLRMMEWIEDAGLWWDSAGEMQKKTAGAYIWWKQWLFFCQAAYSNFSYLHLLRVNFRQPFDASAVSVDCSTVTDIFVYQGYLHYVILFYCYILLLLLTLYHAVDTFLYDILLLFSEAAVFLCSSAIFSKLLTCFFTCCPVSVLICLRFNLSSVHYLFLLLYLQ